MGWPDISGRARAQSPCAGAPNDTPGTETLFTPAGSPVAVTSATTQDLHSVTQTARAGSFGAMDDWNPRATLAMTGTTPPTSPYFGLLPIYPWLSTDFNVAPWPNQWAPLNAQAIYMSGLWGTGTNDQRDQFANRTHHMVGGMFSSAINFESGKDLTRKTDHAASQQFNGSFDAKYAIGTLNQGVILRGGVLGAAFPGNYTTAYDHGDQYSAIGTVGVGQMSLWKTDDFDPESGTSSSYKRIYARALAGGEFIAQVGRRMPLNFGSTSTGPYDLRKLFLKEEDDWEVQVAGIQNLIGATASAVVDTKKSTTVMAPSHFWSTSSTPNCGPQNLGAVTTAVGLKALVAGAVRRSWINVENASNLYAVTTFQEIWKQFNDDESCGTQRTSSFVRNTFGLYVDWTNMGSPATPTRVGRGIGILIEDTQPELVTGSSPLTPLSSAVCGDVYPECEVSRECGASIVARSSVILGDDNNNQGISGWDTDVVYVEGIMRLRPRTNPPQFACCMPAADIQGTIYFDAVTKHLRVAVQNGNTIEWRRLAYVYETHYSVPTGCELQERPERQLSPEEAEAAHLAAIRDGSSDSIPAKVEALPLPAITAESSPIITLLTSGCMREEPVFYFTRVGSEGSLSPDVPWTEIPTEYVAPVSGLSDDSDAWTITMPFDQPGRSGRGPAPGDLIRIIARSRTDGRSAGTTLIFPGRPEEVASR